jgi:hypothetical protein
MWKDESELDPPFIELNLETPQFSRTAATGIQSTGKTRTVMPVSVRKNRHSKTMYIETSLRGGFS